MRGREGIKLTMPSKSEIDGPTLFGATRLGSLCLEHLCGAFVALDAPMAL